MNAMPFADFKTAAKNAQHYYIRPYGIYHRGEVYWDEELPRKKGTVVRFFEDTSGPCTSLVVFNLDGEFICSAYPVAWCENDHPVQREMEAWWKSLSEAERREFLRDVE